MTIGAVEQSLGNYTIAQKHHQTSLELFKNHDYQWGIAHTLRFLGITAYHLGHYTKAQAYHQQSLDICQAINNETGIALALNNLGLVAQALDKADEAYQYYQQSLTSGQESQAYVAQAASLQNLGRLMKILKQPQKSRAYLHQALELAMKTEAAPLILDILLDIALQLDTGGQPEQAAVITTFIQQHPASKWETQTRAAQLQTQFSPSSTPQLATGQAANTLHQIVAGVIGLPDTS